MTPMTSMMLADLMHQAGLPAGVINIVTCTRNEAEILLKHPEINGISFVGSTSVGLHVYATAASHGKESKHSAKRKTMRWSSRTPLLSAARRVS